MAIIVQTDLGSVLLKEQTEDYRKGIGPRGPYIFKTYRCDWPYGNAVANAIAGGVDISGGVAGSITFQAPHVCPESPNLRVTGVEIAGLGEEAPDNGVPRFQYALVLVSYGIADWDPIILPDTAVNSFDPERPITYAVQQITFSSESITMPFGACKFQASPQLPVEERPIIRVPRAGIRVVRKFVPYLPWAKVTGLMERTNDTVLFGRPPGTILFANCQTNREYTSDGKTTQEVEYHFEWRRHEWGKFPRPDTGAFDYVIANGQHLYEQAALETLIYDNDA